MKISLKLSRHPDSNLLNSWLVYPSICMSFPDVLPERMPLIEQVTLTISIGQQTQSEFLGDISYNESFHALFVFHGSPEMLAAEFDIKCVVISSEIKQEQQFRQSISDNFEPLVVAEFFNRQYISIIENLDDDEQIIEALQLSLRNILLQNLEQFEPVQIVLKRIFDTIGHIKKLDMSAITRVFSEAYTASHPNTVIVSNFTDEQKTRYHLCNFEQYDFDEQKLILEDVEYQALNSRLNFYEAFENRQLLFLYNAAVPAHELILIDPHAIYQKKLARKLFIKIKNSDIKTHSDILDLLSQFIVSIYNNTHVAEEVAKYIERFPQYQLVPTEDVAPVNCIPLEILNKSFTGLVRHYALSTAIFCSYLMHALILPRGILRVFNGIAGNKMAYSWVVYQPTEKLNNHLLYLIDPTLEGQKVFVINTSKVRQNITDGDLENAMIVYNYLGLGKQFADIMQDYQAILPTPTVNSPAFNKVPPQITIAPPIKESLATDVVAARPSDQPIRPPQIHQGAATLPVDEKDHPKNDSWLNSNKIATIINKYNKKRGYFFYRTSPESDLLLRRLKDRCAPVNSGTKNAVDEYLATEKNQGKRLFDILSKEKVYSARPADKNQIGQSKSLWLTAELLYLILRKYKKKRGFIFFQDSCVDSLNLLYQLNDATKNLEAKQRAIECFLGDLKHTGSILYVTITHFSSNISDRQNKQLLR